MSIVKPLDWERIEGYNSVWWRAPNPFGGLPFEATTMDERNRRDDNYRAFVLSLLTEPKKDGK